MFGKTILATLAVCILLCFAALVAASPPTDRGKTAAVKAVVKTQTDLFAYMATPSFTVQHTMTAPAPRHDLAAWAPISEQPLAFAAVEVVRRN